jgi:23S rRNA (adenine2503-C2)-methyltransferase
MMGCGEPLDNFAESVRFITLISHPKGWGMGRRHITLSTCGLVPQIDALAALGLPITLAVSLHAPDDDTRRQLMPVARKYPLETLLGACARYTAITKRRITFEYALINGANDSDACAKALAARLRGMLCHVNIIPVNEIAGLPASFTRSTRTEAFARRLSERGIAVTVRKSLGGDVNAACGQLRGRNAGLLPG